MHEHPGLPADTPAQKLQVPLLDVRGLSCRYGGVRALEDVTFQVEAGETVGIVGPSGAGKSALVAALSGALRPRAGRVFLDGTDVTRWPAERRASDGLARTFHPARPLAGLSVRENIALGAMLLHPAREDALDHAAFVAEQVGLDASLRRPAGLLGRLGRARLEIARAWATGPRILLLDSALDGLEEEEAEEIGGIVAEIGAEGIAIVLTAADPLAVAWLCVRTHRLEAGRLEPDPSDPYASGDPHGYWPGAGEGAGHA